MSAKKATILQHNQPPTVGEMMVIDERNAEIIKIGGVDHINEIRVRFWDDGETRWIPNPNAKPTPPPLPRLRLDDKPTDFDAEATATGQPNQDAIADHDDNDETIVLQSEVNRLQAKLTTLEAERDQWQVKYTSAERERQRLELDAKRHDDALSKAQRKALELESKSADTDRWKRRAEAAEARVRLLEATQTRYPGKQCVLINMPANEETANAMARYQQAGWTIAYEQFITSGEKMMYTARLYKNATATAGTPPQSGQMIQAVTALPTITADERPPRDAATLDRIAMENAARRVQDIRAQRQDVHHDGA